VIVIVPVGSVQVGCIIFPEAAEGVAGAALTIKEFNGDWQPAAFCTLITWILLAGSPVKTGEDWYGPPLMLYCNPAPVGELMVIIPVFIAHVGCVTVAVGEAGKVLTVTVTSFVIGQPVAVVLVTVYVVVPGGLAVTVEPDVVFRLVAGLQE